MIDFDARDRRNLWLFFLAATVVLGAGLGLRDPWPADEPRFALVARQMVESGQWLFPMRGHELYPDKPPLFMWIQAALLWLTGSPRISFLLPSLLASLGTLACVYDLGRRFWNRRTGLYAAWLLLFAFQFTYQSKKAQIDPLVTFWITLANYGMLRHLLRGPDWRMWALGWFAAGLGIISKGVGFLAALMLVPAAFAAVRGWRGVALHAREPRFWFGPALMLVAVALWLLPMLAVVKLADNPLYTAYADNLLFHQTVNRYLEAWHHKKSAFYYLEVMASSWLPPLLLLPWAVPAWRRRLRRRDPRFLLPLAWSVIVVLFFSLSTGKRDVYILPVLPMFCLALAPLLPGLLRRRGVQWLGFAACALMALGLAVAAAMVLSGHADLQSRLVLERGFEAVQLRQLGWMLLAMAGVGVVALAWLRPRHGWLAWLWQLGGVWVLFGLVGYPLLNDSSSARAIMAEAGARIGPAAELGLVGWREQNLLMADRPVETFGRFMADDSQVAPAMAWQAEAPARRWLFMIETTVPDCVDRAQATPLGTANRREWWLVPGAATAGCAP